MTGTGKTCAFGFFIWPIFSGKKQKWKRHILQNQIGSATLSYDKKGGAVFFSAALETVKIERQS
jgi:hypothetical protein